MAIHRSRKVQKAYDQYLKERKDSTVCEFCEVSPSDSQFVELFAHFKIIANTFPYARWDSQQVAEHLMIVPIAHTLTLRNLTAEASDEYINLISEYEFKGYNIYARAPSSKSRTVAHQHTHLLKLIPKRPLKTIRISTPNLQKLFSQG